MHCSLISIEGLPQVSGAAFCAKFVLIIVISHASLDGRYSELERLFILAIP